jgi:nudix-type nucleoside diphosphatase (YffH/AdpP family)
MQESANPRVRPVAVEVLADDWFVLRKATFDWRGRDGRWTRQSREAYDRGNGAVILLGDRAARTVLLTRQFRWPAYANGHPDGMLIEAPAGLLDGDTPAEAIRREVAEETGVAIGPVVPLFEVYMSPGSVTERLHFFAASYDSVRGVPVAAGVAEEGEDIELVELPLTDALAMVALGDIVDAKTIMLLQWAERHGLPC